MRTHPLLAALQYNDNVRALKAPPEIHARLPFHFTVVDSDIYRLKRDANSHGAIVAFGDVTLGSTLLKVFSFLEEISHQVQSLEVV